MVYQIISFSNFIKKKDNFRQYTKKCSNSKMELEPALKLSYKLMRTIKTTKNKKLCYFSIHPISYIFRIPNNFYNYNAKTKHQQNLLFK